MRHSLNCHPPAADASHSAASGPRPHELLLPAAGPPVSRTCRLLHIHGSWLRQVQWHTHGRRARLASCRLAVVCRVLASNDRLPQQAAMRLLQRPVPLLGYLPQPPVPQWPHPVSTGTGATTSGVLCGTTSRCRRWPRCSCSALLACLPACLPACLLGFTDCLTATELATQTPKRQLGAVRKDAGNKDEKHKTTVHVGMSLV